MRATIHNDAVPFLRFHESTSDHVLQSLLPSFSLFLLPSLTAFFPPDAPVVMSEYHVGYLDLVAEPTLPHPTPSSVPATTKTTTTAATTTKTTTGVVFEPEVQSCPLEAMTSDLMCLRERVQGWWQGEERCRDDGGNEAGGRNSGSRPDVVAGADAVDVKGDHISSTGLGLRPTGDGHHSTGDMKEVNGKGLNDSNEQINSNNSNNNSGGGVLDSTKPLISSSSSSSPSNSVSGSSHNPTGSPSSTMINGSDNTSSSRTGDENTPLRMAVGDAMDGSAAGGGAAVGTSNSMSLSMPSVRPLEVVYEAPDERESSGHGRESSRSSMRGDRSPWGGSQSVGDSDKGPSRRGSLFTPLGSPGTNINPYSLATPPFSITDSDIIIIVVLIIIVIIIIIIIIVINEPISDIT